MDKRPEIGTTVHWRTDQGHSSIPRYLSAKVLYTSERDGHVSVTVDRPAIPWQPNGYNLTLPLECLLESIPEPDTREAAPFADLGTHWNIPLGFNGD